MEPTNTILMQLERNEVKHMQQTDNSTNFEW